MKFVVECIGKPRTEFGDSLDSKCVGSIDEEDSRLTAENGFSEEKVGRAQNPFDYIDYVIKKGKKPRDMRF